VAAATYLKRYTAMKFGMGLIALSVLCTSCISLNPYVRVGSHMLSHDGLTFCWAPVKAKAEESSCKAEQLASSSLTDCVAQLRREVTFLTSEEIAEQRLTSCMSTKGWQRVWIGGAMLFGERHNYSLKRTAANRHGVNSKSFAAAAA